MASSLGMILERRVLFFLNFKMFNILAFVDNEFYFAKPIFSRYGDEQDLVTTFGLLQAVISIALDSGDTIRCIRAGSRKIVYFMKQSLYFVSISSTNEPEVVLLKQLHFSVQSNAPGVDL